jgi:rod shape determining protein RodA
MRIAETEKFDFSLGDLLLIGSMILLIAIGMLTIYSATAGQGSQLSSNFQNQIYWFILGIVIFLVTISFPPQFYHALAYIIYGLVVVSLIAVLFIGRSGGGAERWLSIAGFRFQPSEWAKIAVIFALARYLADHKDELYLRKNLIISAAIGVVPMLLIFKQPDLGTSLVFIAVIPSIMYWAGVSPLILFLTFLLGLTMLASFKLWSFFFVMGFLILVLYLNGKKIIFSVAHIFLNVSVGVLTPFFWNSLEKYQQTRVLSFLGLVSDPKGVSYQVIQSKVAIGSGGLIGKGYLSGTQTQLRFLPEQHTDFIFSVIGEEFGFLGCAVVLCLFVILLIRGIQIASSVKNRFASFVAIGIVTMFVYHFFVNIGMVMGIMPVTGLPLPFISYGGSFLITSMIAVALLLNFSIRKHQY